MGSVEGSPSEEGDQVEAAGIVEGMEKVNLEDADFSLELLTQHFKDSTAAPGLCLASYVKGYREVYKFLNLLGTVFGWVGSDVWAKIVQLEKYLAGDEKEHYQNIKSMIDYEVEHDLIKTKKKDDPSGSRTLCDSTGPSSTSLPSCTSLTTSRTPTSALSYLWKPMRQRL